ncbi:hypothetical protein KP509_18G070600 [Ceratopteris richardii]|uniref:Uncharacterized protein n=1 Tax=Ceratopteris richardii TaxID=49495 RepID=A0A8T2SSB1_CERRI|nr:hypothetical protein KP509_18G070600 [Ceratopteris richardii]
MAYNGFKQKGFCNSRTKRGSSSQSSLRKNLYNTSKRGHNVQATDLGD